MAQKDFIEIGGAHYRTSLIASVTPVEDGKAAVFFSKSVVEKRNPIQSGSKAVHDHKLEVKGEEAEQLLAWVRDRSFEATENDSSEDIDYLRV